MYYYKYKYKFVTFFFYIFIVLSLWPHHPHHSHNIRWMLREVVTQIGRHDKPSGSAMVSASLHVDSNSSVQISYYRFKTPVHSTGIITIIPIIYINTVIQICRRHATRIQIALKWNTFTHSYFATAEQSSQKYAQNGCLLMHNAEIEMNVATALTN